MIGGIIVIVLVFGIGIWAIISNAVSNHISDKTKENVRKNLPLVRVGMTKNEVISILGKGYTIIDYETGRRFREEKQKNDNRGYFTKNIFMDSNPIYYVDVPEGYECLYYGGEKFNYGYNGYKETQTRSYWGIGLYFKDDILEYIS